MGISRLAAAAGVVAALGLGACGDGEDRPGQVTSESDPGSGTHSGSGSGTGSASGPGGGHAHGGPEKRAFAEGEEDSRVEVTMRDFAFAMPATVKGEKVLFSVTNEGPGEHEFKVVKENGEAVAEIEPYAKGATKTLALELAPGAYTAQCLLEEGARTHAELGMETRFTVE